MEFIYDFYHYTIMHDNDIFTKTCQRINVTNIPNVPVLLQYPSNTCLLYKLEIY